MTEKTQSIFQRMVIIPLAMLENKDMPNIREAWAEAVAKYGPEDVFEFTATYRDEAVLKDDYFESKKASTVPVMAAYFEDESPEAARDRANLFYSSIEDEIGKERTAYAHLKVLY